MAKFIKGNLWEHIKDFSDGTVVVPCNSLIKVNGELVMGAGFAKQANTKLSHSYFNVSEVLGQRILEIGKSDKDNQLFYGFTYPVKFGEGTRAVSAFQSKYSWRDLSTLELIQKSTNVMSYKVGKYPSWKTFHMACPGIGLGGLSLGEAEPILEVLPNNVYIYYL